ncbi:hypothetical protein [Mucilaginibacter flavus]|uniref:hypothetical protein n=1 Tax=Mucilaginibacter flavus TaxID=931504 RepID=UPI0025B34DDC|nr:hypothetical protein [Mucilaginibacter flavus]MDN3581346.1 hypothetical protein [Mucilaginibacter flavus]
MKRFLSYLLPILLIFAVACSPKSTSTVVPAPSGTFSGQFRFYTKNSSGNYDSLRTSITLKLTTDYHFKVTGDTSTVHAGSHGTFSYDGYYMLFGDSTYSATAPKTKKHLSGLFQYLYDGTNLKMLRSTSGSSPDTIGRYDLSRTLN